MQRALVDGNNIATAAFSVSGSLKNSKGVYTGTVLTTLDMMRTLLKNMQGIDQITFAWDSSPSWRHKFFPEYKSNRTPKASRSPEEGFDWYQQKFSLQMALTWFGIPQVQVDEMEADDIAGAWMRVPDQNVIYVSNDRDWLQVLQNPNSIIYRPCDKKVVTPADIEQWTQCTSIEEYISMKAITGDPGDFIPGVQGVGPVKALQFLRGQMKAGPTHHKIKQWMEAEDGFNRSLTLYQLGLIPIQIHGSVHMTPPQYNEDEIKRILEDYEAHARLKNFDNFIAPFRELNRRYRANLEAGHEQDPTTHGADSQAG